LRERTEAKIPGKKEKRTFPRLGRVKEREGHWDTKGILVSAIKPMQKKGKRAKRHWDGSGYRERGSKGYKNMRGIRWPEKNLQRRGRRKKRPHGLPTTTA